jgi:hypothetical protein
MSAAHENAVHPLLECPQHMVGRHAPGAHDTDDPDICRVLHTTDPSQVSSGVCSPGAQKTDDMGFKLCVVHLFLSLYMLTVSLFVFYIRPEYFRHFPRTAQAAPIWARS